MLNKHLLAKGRVFLSWVVLVYSCPLRLRFIERLSFSGSRYVEVISISNRTEKGIM